MGAKVFIHTKDHECAVKLNDNFVNPATKGPDHKDVYACDRSKAELEGNELILAVTKKEASGPEAEKARRAGHVKLVDDKEFKWSLHACKNKCNIV